MLSSIAFFGTLPIMMNSDYFQTLIGDSKSRYLDKIKVINNQDPYALSKEDFSSDIKDLPDVGYMDMVNYLVYGISHYTAEELKAYKSLQAYNFFKCGWVSSVYTRVFPGMHLVIGKVKHSQRLNEKPLQPWFISTPSGIIQSAHCTCMAGLGESCTHVAALMFFVQDIIANKGETSVTSVAPYWGQSNKSVPFAEVKDITFSTKEKCTKTNASTMPSIPRMNRAEFEALCEKLNSQDCKSAILNVVANYNKIDSNRLYISNIFKEELREKTLEELQKAASVVKFDISVAEADEINRETKSQTKCRKWFLYRAGRITASTLKAVCCTDINSPAISTIKNVCYPSKVVFTSKFTTWGCMHEKKAKQDYISHQKKDHPTLQVSSCGLIINPDYPYLGASPDGLVWCECCGLGCLEIKCPYCLRNYEDSLEDHSCLKNLDKGTKLSKKKAYYYQVQCQLFCSQRSYCDFVLWKKNEIRVERIYPDSDFWNEVSLKAENFFKRVILPEMMGKVFTEPCFSDGTSRKTVPLRKNPNIVFL